MKTILISGPQGSGKTSLIYNLSNDFREYEMGDLDSANKRRQNLLPSVILPKTIVIDETENCITIEHIIDYFKNTDKNIVFVTQQPAKVFEDWITFDFVYELKPQ